MEKALPACAVAMALAGAAHADEHSGTCAAKTSFTLMSSGWPHSGAGGWWLMVKVTPTLLAT